MPEVNRFSAGTPVASLTYRLALVCLCTAIIIATFGFGLYLFSALATDMRAELGFSYTAVGSMIAVAQLGFLGASVGSSLLVPRYGEEKVVTGAAGLCGLGLLGLGTVSDLWLVSALLIILAACAAAAWTPMVGLVAKHIAYEHRAKAMGMIGSGTSYGIFINGLILPWLLPDYGWRSIWLLLGVSTLLVTLLAVAVMLRGNSATSKPREEDPAGFVQQLPDLRKAAPWNLLAGVFLAGVGFIAYMNYFAMYALDGRQLGVAECGELLMIIGAVGMLAGIICGVLADKIGIRPVIALMCLALLAAAALVVTDAALTGLYVAAGLFGSAYVGYFAMVPAYIGKKYPVALTTSIFGGANLQWPAAQCWKFSGWLEHSATGQFHSGLSEHSRTGRPVADHDPAFAEGVSLMLHALPENSCYRIGLVLLPGYSLMSVASVITPLSSANRISGKPLYSWQVLSPDGAAVRSADGMLYPVDMACEQTRALDAVIICAGDNADLYPVEGLKSWLKQLLKHAGQPGYARETSLHLGALDAGSYLLAKMGLLDGYSCTVHWDYLTVMKESFPRVEVNKKLFVFDRNRFTCAGATATLDMLLYLICYHQGGELCAAISEQLNCERIRDEQDNQRAPMQNYLGVGQPQLVEAIALMEANLEEPINSAELALLVGVSRRHLERQFQKFLQTTPSRYYLQLRLQRAQQLLRQTNLSLLDVGLACGFANKTYFCKCYRDYFAIPPGEERRSQQQSRAVASDLLSNG